DLGTPRPEWNAYDELRDQLVARGLPRESVRFVHEVTNDTELARLFAACRSGHVAVLIGSTEKMGVGTNVQDRAVALHHLPTPWPPRAGPPTSTSAKAASSGKATSTPKSGSSAGPLGKASTATCGRPWSAKPGSSAMSCRPPWMPVRSAI